MAPGGRGAQVSAPPQMRPQQPGPPRMPVGGPPPGMMGPPPGMMGKLLYPCMIICRILEFNSQCTFQACIQA